MKLPLACDPALKVVIRASPRARIERCLVTLISMPAPTAPAKAFSEVSSVVHIRPMLPDGRRPPSTASPPPPVQETIISGELTCPRLTPRNPSKKGVTRDQFRKLKRGPKRKLWSRILSRSPSNVGEPYSPEKPATSPKRQVTLT